MWQKYIVEIPLLVLIVAMVFINVCQILPSAVGTYYIMYNLNRPDLVGLGLSLGSLTSFAGIAAAPALSKGFGDKRAVSLSFIAIFATGFIGFFAAPFHVMIFMARGLGGIF